MEQILSWIGENMTSVLALLAMFGITIEVMPVKISPLKWIGQRMNNSLENKVDRMRKDIASLDKNQCKNYLVRFLADVERGEKMNDVEVARAYDAYDHYTDDLEGNSYIHDKWEKLMKNRGDKK